MPETGRLQLPCAETLSTRAFKGDDSDPANLSKSCRGIYIQKRGITFVENRPEHSQISMQVLCIHVTPLDSSFACST